MLDIACFDDLFTGRALPLLYALFNTDPDSHAWALLAMLTGMALAIAIAVWRTERMLTPTPTIAALDASVCIAMNATLLFHKAHRLDRDTGVSLTAIPLFVSLILLSEHECSNRLRCIALAGTVLIMLPLVIIYSLYEEDPPQNLAPSSSIATYLFVCLTAGYAVQCSQCNVQAMTARAAIIAATAALSTNGIASLLIDRVGHGAIFTIQMALVVMPSSFIHVKTLRAILGSTRSLMLAVAVILAAAFDSPVRFHAPAVLQQSSWAVAVLTAAAVVDVMLP